LKVNAWLLAAVAKRREKIVLGTVSRKIREIDNAGNSLEKIIYRWGQMSIHDNLSPFVCEV
jgi:hypothetical protein